MVRFSRLKSLFSPKAFIAFCLLLHYSVRLPCAHAASAVSAPIEELNDRFLQVMKASKTMQFQQRYAVLAPTVKPTFDLPFARAERDWRSLGFVDGRTAYRPD